MLPLDRLRVTRSLRKVIGRYEIRIDTSFDAVLAGCADPRRPNGWIDDDIAAVYRGLHERGIVHTVEAWTPDNQLAGGLYGVSIGGLFAGESMFHRPDIGRDASKVALVALVRLLRAAGGAGSTCWMCSGRRRIWSRSGRSNCHAGTISPAEAALRLPPPVWSARPTDRWP